MVGSETLNVWLSEFIDWDGGESISPVLLGVPVGPETFQDFVEAGTWMKIMIKAVRSHHTKDKKGVR